MTSHKRKLFLSNILHAELSILLSVVSLACTVYLSSETLGSVLLFFNRKIITFFFLQIFCYLVILGVPIKAAVWCYNNIINHNNLNIKFGEFQIIGTSCKKYILFPTFVLWFVLFSSNHVLYAKVYSNNWMQNSNNCSTLSLKVQVLSHRYLDTWNITHSMIYST